MKELLDIILCALVIKAILVGTEFSFIQYYLYGDEYLNWFNRQQKWHQYLSEKYYGRNK